MTMFTINWLWCGLSALLALVLIVLMYNGRTKTKQRRFIYLLWALLCSTIIYCVMANHQFRFTRVDGITVTFGRWVLHFLTHGSLGALIVAGISTDTHVINSGFVLVSASALADLAGSFAPSENGGNDRKALIACASIAWVLTAAYAVAFALLPYLGRFIFGKDDASNSAGRVRVQNNIWYSLSAVLFALVRAIFTLFMFIGPEGLRVYAGETLQIWLCGALQVGAMLYCMAIMVWLDPTGDSSISGVLSSAAKSAAKAAKKAVSSAASTTEEEVDTF